jgi:hypothetical protein
MADENQLNILKQGIAAWNEWRPKEAVHVLAAAILSGADLRGGYLIGIHLGSANLGGADLRDADLSRRNFGEALFVETDISNADRGRCKGFELSHHGPSPIDIRTLQRSGPLPLVFLRSVGLPDKLIEYLPSLLDHAIQFYKCFISYSAKDPQFVRRLHADLQDSGVRCWLEPEDMKIGAKIH